MVEKIRNLLDRAAQTLPPLLGIVVAMLVLRLPDLLCDRATVAGCTNVGAQILANEFLTLLHWLPLWCVAAWPLTVIIEHEKARQIGFGLLGSFVVILHGALIYYFTTAGVPLGADLFSYNLDEIVTTSSAAAQILPSVSQILPLVFGLLIMWFILLFPTKVWRRKIHASVLVFVLLICGSSWLWLPTGLDATNARSAILKNKLDYFLSDIALKLMDEFFDLTRTKTVESKFPFARLEKTPDTLGPLFNLKNEAPPNFVFIIVEGLGRSFSGPKAPLGSFTPFLDELAQNSLYWPNFLATQGRTFAVLPSIFGSLPFAKQGFNAIEPMPAHDSLLSLLKSDGYNLRYYTGTQLEFDKQGRYLLAEGVDTLFSEKDFKEPLRRSTEWGYADGDLLKTVIEKEREAKSTPFVTIVQTISTHSPFDFPGRAAYERRVDERLKEIGVTPNSRPDYSSHRRIYASLLYADDTLREFVGAMSVSPSWSNTILVITGDHRLPDLEMNTRLERFHVPLIVASPMLRAPRLIGSVSSHFDIAPSLLAMLSHKYGLRTPSVVTWMGSGLDVEPEFRNVHSLPLQQTKTDLKDYIAGEYYLAQGQLYRLSDGMRASEVDNPVALKRLISDFASFRDANVAIENTPRLSPLNTATERIGYIAAQRSFDYQEEKNADSQVLTSNAQAKWLNGETVKVQGSFNFNGRDQSPIFVPLLVLTDAKGVELSEVSGKALRLKSGESINIELEMPYRPKSANLSSFFVSLIVSDPNTGKSIGIGQYHIPIAN